MSLGRTKAHSFIKPDRHQVKNAVGIFAIYGILSVISAETAFELPLAFIEQGFGSLPGGFEIKEGAAVAAFAGSYLVSGLLEEYGGI